MIFRRVQFILLFSIFCCVAVLAGDSFAPDVIVGNWYTGDSKAKVQIYKSNGKYYGKIIWLKVPNYPNGMAKVDRNNPKAALRNRPLIGLVILRDFAYDTDDMEYSDGYIYDPESGSEYDSFMKLDNSSSLNVRGYIGFSIIGRTQTWKRATD